MTLELINNAAEFHADSHFNLHLEGVEDVALYKRTSGQGWDFVTNLSGNVIDEDVAVNIPKDYKIVCQGRPSMMVVTFSDGTVADVEW